MTRNSICLAPDCGIVAEGRRSSCPHCGAPARPLGKAPARGWLMLAIGLFLVLLMASATFWMAPMLLNPGEEVSGITFDGSPAAARFILGLFALVALFGLLAAVAGAQLVVSGTRSRRLVKAAVVLFLVVMIVAEVAPLLI